MHYNALPLHITITTGLNDTYIYVCIFVNVHYIQTLLSEFVTTWKYVVLNINVAPIKTAITLLV